MRPWSPAALVAVVVAAACATPRPATAPAAAPAAPSPAVSEPVPAARAPEPPPSPPSAPTPAAADSRAAFESTVKPILVSSCMPCHFPGGKMYDKLPFDDPTVVASHSEGVLRRIKAP